MSHSASRAGYQTLSDRIKQEPPSAMLHLFKSLRKAGGAFPTSAITAHPHSAGMALSVADLIQENRRKRKEQYQRLTPQLIRITIGNEITDYQLAHRENEILWETDFSKMLPLDKYFGRFTNGKFTGIKYNFSYFFEHNHARQYVEAIVEYRQGRPYGLQIYFDPHGEVLRRYFFDESSSQPITEV